MNIIKYVQILFIITSVSGCLKRNFDAPPDTTGYDPGLVVNYAIRDLVLLPQNTVITDDITISGIVVMDDKEGNYYKKIVIQDTTGGIEILLDQNSLYNDYPVGRKVYVQCKGLFIGAYGQNPQLGYMPDATGNLSNIPFSLISNHVVKASYPHVPAPDTFTISQLAIPDKAKARLNTLIAIKDVEFSAVAVPFAEPAGIQSATNRMLQDCNGDEITLRTSGYAKFQALIVPSGNGVITAIYTRYKNTPQLYIRGADDALLTGARCNGAIGVQKPISIDSVRSLVTSTEDSVAALASYKITGVVISDKGSGNIVTSNIVLQDITGGIVVRFSGTPSFALGDSLLIDITGCKLSWYNKLLQVSGVPVSKASRLNTGNTIMPRLATIDQVMANYNLWESTLVKIANAMVIEGGTYSGSKTLSDDSGSMMLYTRPAASFSGENVPAATASFTGILGAYGSSKQLLMRNLSDVE